MKVLLVDDDEITLEILENMLQSDGHATRTAVNGLQGLELFRDFHPELIITDIEMPLLNGLAMLERIRERNSDVIVVVATGHGCESYAIQALRSRANDYLRKPIDQNILLPLIQKYAVALEANQRLRRAVRHVLKSEMVLCFGNELNLATEIAEYLTGQASGLMAYDELTMVRLALSELITNAIEHGNLEITSAMKSEATRNFGGYFEFLRQRQFDPKFIHRQVKISAHINPQWCEWVICDEGPGFRWQELPSEFTADSLAAFHGRGILISRIQFDELEYQGNGNSVRVRKYVKAGAPGALEPGHDVTSVAD